MQQITQLTLLGAQGIFAHLCTFWGKSCCSARFGSNVIVLNALRHRNWGYLTETGVFVAVWLLPRTGNRGVLKKSQGRSRTTLSVNHDAWIQILASSWKDWKLCKAQRFKLLCREQEDNGDGLSRRQPCWKERLCDMVKGKEIWRTQKRNRCFWWWGKT